MICPFCQTELDVDKMACPNCGAEVRGNGVRWNIRLRSLAISAGLLVVAAMMLNDCVFNYLPGGKNSSFYAPGSPQAALGPGPRMKTPQLQALLEQWQNKKPQSQNPISSVPRTH